MGKTKRYIPGKNAHPTRNKWDLVHEDKRYKQKKRQTEERELDEEIEEPEEENDYFWRKNYTDDWETE